MVEHRRLEEIRHELVTAPTGSYVAFNALWLCLVKMANLLPTAGEEHEQIASLLRKLSREQAARVLASSELDILLGLKPPLEAELAEARERLQPVSATRELVRVRERRTTDPKAAMLSLFEILQRIRDKREHGFKSAGRPRDLEILEPAAAVLRAVCHEVEAYLSSLP